MVSGDRFRAGLETQALVVVADLNENDQVGCCADLRNGDLLDDGGCPLGQANVEFNALTQGAPVARQHPNRQIAVGQIRPQRRDSHIERSVPGTLNPMTEELQLQTARSTIVQTRDRQRHSTANSRPTRNHHHDHH